MEQRPADDSVFSDVVYSRNVIEFVTVANEFCSFAESAGSLSRKIFLSRLQKMLPLLYLKASLLPDPGEPDEETETPEKFVSEEDYEFVLGKIKARLGELDGYPEIFDPAAALGEMIESSIAENVADIYQDLKDFILAYRIGTTDVMRAALRECRNNFEQYWGQRLVNGLRAVHMLVYGNTTLE